VISTELKNGVMPFHAEDMLWIIENGVKEFGLKYMLTEDLRELAIDRENNEQCVTAWVDGEIIGCGGIDIMWEGVGEVWLLMSYETDKCMVKSYRLIRNGIKKLINDNNLQRCQGWCRVGFTKGHTLFRHLGFEPEGIARKYLPDGTDAILYARII